VACNDGSKSHYAEHPIASLVTTRCGHSHRLLHIRVKALTRNDRVGASEICAEGEAVTAWPLSTAESTAIEK